MNKAAGALLRPEHLVAVILTSVGLHKVGHQAYKLRKVNKYDWELRMHPCHLRVPLCTIAVRGGPQGPE
jgi:hypothetical protein